MIVGKTGSGKSVSWQMLQQVLTTMKKEGAAGYNLVKVFNLLIFLLQEIESMHLNLVDSAVTNFAFVL